MIRWMACCSLLCFADVAFAAPPDDKVPAKMTRVPTTMNMGGDVGGCSRAVINQWLLPAPHANPAMLDMFRDRDRKPPRQMEPWAGEFAGKYLTSAVQTLRIEPNRDLEQELQHFVAELISLQADDGYLGPWPKEHRLTGNAPNAGNKTTWDAWGHYHAMLGLLLWHEETKDPSALAAAKKISDLFCNRFLGDKKPRLVDTGSTEMNLAPAHSLCLLYKATGEERYLKLAKQIVDVEFAAKDAAGKPLAGDWLNEGLAGKEFFTGPKPRWESLHPMMAMAELHRITGDERYFKAFEHLWWSICKLDRHNNGGFSSGEQAQGNPYHPGAIETCCTIAWLAMSVEMLRTTGNSIVADELELTTLNSGLGMWSPSGRWATYNTPMDGVRKASAHDIVFQSREGSPELNCCSVNAARGLGMISDWALMEDAEGLVLNWYGDGFMNDVQTKYGPLRLWRRSKYPAEPEVELRIYGSEAVEWTLKLRIPHWSKKTVVTVNDNPVPNVLPGTYLPIKRRWEERDSVKVRFDFTPHYWVGERECAGKVSAYRGPILLTWDRRLNDDDSPDRVIDASKLPGQLIVKREDRQPMLMLELPAKDGKPIRLCDFASAGQGGSPYRSWLKIDGPKPAAFSKTNPLRTARLE